MAAFAHAKPIRSLAAMAGSGTLLQPGSPVAEVTDAAARAAMPDPHEYRFALEGLSFAVTITLLEEGFHFRIMAPLGPVPFSAQNPAARVAVLTILKACRSLDRARFVVGPSQMMWVLTEAELSESATPEAVIHETVLFLQEALPYLRLLGRHLQPATPARRTAPDA